MRSVTCDGKLLCNPENPCLRKMSPSSSSAVLPQSVYNPRRHVGIHAERVSDVSSTEYPGHYPDEDHSWNLDTFKKVCTTRRVREMRIGCANSACLCMVNIEPTSEGTTTITAVHRVRPRRSRCFNCERIPKDTHCRGTPSPECSMVSKAQTALRFRRWQLNTYMYGIIRRLFTTKSSHTVWVSSL